MDAYVNLCLRETDLGWMTGEFDLDYLSKISHVITSDDIFRKLLQDRTKKDQNMMKSRRQTVSGMWRTGLTGYSAILNCSQLKKYTDIYA